MDPPVYALKAELTYELAKFSPGGPNGFTATSDEHSLHDFDFRNRLIIPTGLVTRIIERLRLLGYAPIVIDRREFTPRQCPDPDVLAQASGADRRFLQAVADNFMGQIEVRSVPQSVRRTVQICRLFHSARIVLAVATRQRARGLRHLLQDQLKFSIGLACAGTCAKRRRITVTTFTYAASVDPREIDLVVLSDASEAGGQLAKWMLGGVSGYSPRIYAFARPNQPLGAAERLCLEAMAGQVVYCLGEPAREVRGLICPSTFSRAVTGADGLERKRRGIWHNRGRNALIARVARAFAVRDLLAVGKIGITLDSAASLLSHLPDLRVAVLVENTEHARELKKHLRGWDLLSLMPNDQQASNDSEAHPESQPRREIITLSYASRHRIDADVLIRADADSCTGYRGFSRPERGRMSLPILLIDLRDNHVAPHHRRQDQHRRKRHRQGDHMGGNLHPPADSHSRHTDAHAFRVSANTNRRNETAPATPTPHTRGEDLPTPVTTRLILTNRTIVTDASATTSAAAPYPHTLSGPATGIPLRSGKRQLNLSTPKGNIPGDTPLAENITSDAANKARKGGQRSNT